MCLVGRAGQDRSVCLSRPRCPTWNCSATGGTPMRSRRARRWGITSRPFWRKNRSATHVNRNAHFLSGCSLFALWDGQPGRSLWVWHSAFRCAASYFMVLGRDGGSLLHAGPSRQSPSVQPPLQLSLGKTSCLALKRPPLGCCPISPWRRMNFPSISYRHRLLGNAVAGRVQPGWWTPSPLGLLSRSVGRYFPVGFFNLHCVWLVGAARTNTYYMPKWARTDLLDELVFPLDLLFNRQHAWGTVFRDVL